MHLSGVVVEQLWIVAPLCGFWAMPMCSMSLIKMACNDRLKTFRLTPRLQPQWTESLVLQPSHVPAESLLFSAAGAGRLGWTNARQLGSLAIPKHHPNVLSLCFFLQSITKAHCEVRLQTGRF